MTQHSTCHSCPLSHHYPLMQDRSVRLGFHLSAECPLLRFHMACIFRPHVTLSFVHLSRSTCNSNLLGIRRNLTMYLDFARRTQRYNPRRHPISREIPRFATRVYHFTLSGVSHPSPLKRISSQNSHTHIHTITCICNSHFNAK